MVWPMSLSRIGSVTVVVVLPAAVLTIWSVTHDAGRDYIQFHAAAKLLAAGENPYGAVEQALVQRPYRNGPDPDDPYDRLGFLPYFYPPWLALGCIPLSQLSFPVAKAIWLFFGALCLAASGAGLAHGRVTPIAAVLLGLGLMPCYYAIQLGQTTPLIIALLALAIGSLDRGADRRAGAALAGLTIKPQLSVVVIPVALIWAARRGRWNVLASFAGVLTALMLACTWLTPSWPVEMLLATRRTPLPTMLDPSVGVTWLCVLRTLGLSSCILAGGYTAAAVPSVIFALTAALGQRRRVEDAISRGVIAAFFVAPYGLAYDLAVLLVPLLVLLPALSERAALRLLVVAMLGPYLALAGVVAAGARFAMLFWIPTGLMLVSTWPCPGFGGPGPENRGC
jgi:hypothetical protein